MVEPGGATRDNPSNLVVERPTAKRATALWGLTVLTLMGVLGIGGYVVHRLHHGEGPTVVQHHTTGGAAQGVDRQGDEVLRLAGSGSNIPLMRVLVTAFGAGGASQPIMVHRSIGSTGGIRALRDGVIDLAMVSRPLTAAEQGADLLVLPYARVAVVVAVHPAVPVDGLTAAELLAVYRGERVTWSPDVKLALLLRERGDSSHLALARWLPGFGAADEEAHRAHRGRVVYSDPEMQTALMETEGAIGLFDLGAVRVQRLPLKVLRLDGFEASLSSLGSGDYPIHKDLALVARRRAEGRAGPFLRFLASEAGQQAIAAAGYLPLPQEAP